MVLITTRVEIAASPEHTREVFLDWPSYSTWCHHQFKSIAHVDVSKTPHASAKGDSLSVHLENTSFKSTVLANTPQVFTWRGSLPLIFTGDHSFRFFPSETTPGGTTFVHEEQFSGLLSPLINFIGDTKKGFEGFNVDFKKRVEETK